MGGCEIFNLTNPKGKVKHYKFPSYNLSPYLYSFMYAMTYRYSCYDCKFARIPRQGDITLADYWGVKEFFPNLDSSKGISLTLVNSSKGAVIFEQIKNVCEVWHSTIADGAKHNGNLIHVSEKNRLREISYREVKEKGYAKVAKKTFRAPNYYSTLIKCKLAEYKIIKDFIEWKNRRK